MFSNAEHSLNIFSPIDVSYTPGSNIIVSRFLQPLNALLPIFFIDCGIYMYSADMQFSNALAAIAEIVFGIYTAASSISELMHDSIVKSLLIDKHGDIDNTVFSSEYIIESALVVTMHGYIKDVAERRCGRYSLSVLTNDDISAGTSGNVKLVI